MSRSYKLFFAFLSIVLMIGLCASKKHYAFSQTGWSESKLEAANNAIEQAFRAVLDAEQAGANVTGLLARLNVAADLLAQAEIAVRKGDLSVGIEADSALSIAGEVEAAAVAARDAALDAGQSALYSTVAYSSVGVVVFVLVLFLVWRQLKQSYVRRLFEAKPEVSVSEA
jgi:hypothetical protein